MLNIFILDPVMKLSAQYTYDIHLNKEILEICQILCLVRKSKGLTYLPSYVPTRHINNPLVKWTASSYLNYLYVYRYMQILEVEFLYRQSRTVHKTVYDYRRLVAEDNDFTVMNLFDTEDALPRLAYMRPEFIISKNSIVDVVASYRCYYYYYKNYTLPSISWSRRARPYWYNQNYFIQKDIVIDTSKIDFYT